MNSKRIPQSGDLCWVLFDGTLGSEQRDLRPALVLSTEAYNAVSNRAIVCPISSRSHHGFLDVPLPPGGKVAGYVLSDQIRAIDREARNFRIIERAPDDVLNAVRQRVAGLIGIFARSA